MKMGEFRNKKLYAFLEKGKPPTFVGGFRFAKLNDY